MPIQKASDHLAAARTRLAILQVKQSKLKWWQRELAKKVQDELGDTLQEADNLSPQGNNQ